MIQYLRGHSFCHAAPKRSDRPRAQGPSLRGHLSGSAGPEDTIRCDEKVLATSYCTARVLGCCLRQARRGARRDTRISAPRASGSSCPKGLVSRPRLSSWHEKGQVQGSLENTPQGACPKDPQHPWDSNSRRHFGYFHPIQLCHHFLSICYAPNGALIIHTVLC